MHGDKLAKSTIFTTQLPLDQWFELIADPVIADVRLRTAAVVLKFVAKDQSSRGVNDAIDMLGSGFAGRSKRGEGKQCTFHGNGNNGTVSEGESVTTMMGMTPAEMFKMLETTPVQGRTVTEVSGVGAFGAADVDGGGGEDGGEEDARRGGVTV